MVTQIKKKFNLTTNEELIAFSLNYIMSNPNMPVPIPGSTSAAQLEQNLRVLGMPRFTPGEWKEIHDFVVNLSLNTVD